MKIAASLALSLLLTGCATAVIVPPSWRRTADAEALAAAYPLFAQDAGIEGAVPLVCAVDIEGKLGSCKVRRARPRGLGFEAAALSLTSGFEAVPKTRDGIAIPSHIAFTLHFALPPPDAIPVWDGPEPSEDAMAAARILVARRPPPGLLNGPGAVKLDGLEADRVETVRAMIGQVETEHRREMREAYALALARSVRPEILVMSARGNRFPSRPNISEEEMGAASNEIARVTQKQNDRLNALYCARYACR